MQFNGKELSAIVKMAAAMASADGKVEDVEQKAIALELVKFGASSEQATTMLAAAELMEPATALSVIASMSSTQKKYVSGFLAVIMACDGDIDDNEVNLWQFVCTMSGCPTMTIAEALKFWKDN